MTLRVPRERPRVPFGERDSSIRSTLAVRSPTMTSLARALNYLHGHGTQLVPAFIVPSPPGLQPGDDEAIFRFYAIPTADVVSLLWTVELINASPLYSSSAVLRAPATTGVAREASVVRTSGGAPPTAYLQHFASAPTPNTPTEFTFGVDPETSGNPQEGSAIVPRMISCCEIPREDLPLSGPRGLDTELVRPQEPGEAPTLNRFQDFRTADFGNLASLVAISSSTNHDPIVSTTSSTFVDVFDDVLRVHPRWRLASEDGGVRTVGIRAWTVGSGQVRVSSTIASDSVTFGTSGTGWSGEATLDVAAQDSGEAPELFRNGSSQTESLTVEHRALSGTHDFFALSVYPKAA